MNGIHDMGGMQDMGAIRPEKNEPVFHEPWEARALAMLLATSDLVPPNLSGRFAIEQIPPAEYLRMSYYERFMESMVTLLVKAGVVTRAEFENGTPAPGSAKAKPVLPAAKVAGWVTQDQSARLKKQVPARFKVKQRVRARNINPAGHTRLPRYARGKAGTIVRDHGVFAFEDSDASGVQQEKPQHVYSVRFQARELWGDRVSPNDSVFIDLWDDYLEPA